MDEVTAAVERTVVDIREVARNLRHPSAIRLLDNPSDLNPAGLEVDDEEHEVSDQAVSREHFDAKAGDLVVIENADQNEYNGIQTVLNPSTNLYSFAVAGSPTTPATGTILATTAIISGLTDVNGEIEDTRTYSVDQPLGGRVRKSTTSPFYKTGAINGTVDKDNGLPLTIVMLSDE